MISCEERREVADRFRAAADALEADEQMTDGELADAVYDAAGVTVEHYTGDVAEIDRALLRRLADLIVRPTCRDLGGEFGFLCSACGFSADDVFASFCPSCGAEVVA